LIPYTLRDSEREIKEPERAAMRICRSYTGLNFADCKVYIANTIIKALMLGKGDKYPPEFRPYTVHYDDYDIRVDGRPTIKFKTTDPKKIEEGKAFIEEQYTSFFIEYKKE
jgi:hypothetical protein